MAFDRGWPDDDWGAAITIATDGSIYVAGSFKLSTSVFGLFVEQHRPDSKDPDDVPHLRGLRWEVRPDDR